MCFLQDTIEYMTVGVCVHFMKKSFSQTVSEPEFLLSTYNISTDQSKDDYHLVTAGDYVLNTLLVTLVILTLVQIVGRVWGVGDDNCHHLSLTPSFGQ